MKLHDIAPNKRPVDLWRQFYPDWQWRERPNDPDGFLEFAYEGQNSWNPVDITAEMTNAGFQRWLADGTPDVPSVQHGGNYRLYDRYIYNIAED
jgi:hypothetical protein